MAKLNLTNIINDQDKEVAVVGALVGLVASAVYGAVTNIHSFKDFWEIGVKWGPAYVNGFKDFLKASLYTVPSGAVLSYIGSKVHSLLKK